ncbi:hypothetical protein Tco_0008643, partial [Tanacetum coccineum]
DDGGVMVVVGSRWWWLWRGDDSSSGGCRVRRQRRLSGGGGVEARGNAWDSGSDRSVDGEHIWSWPEKSAEKFSGGRKWRRRCRAMLMMSIVAEDTADDEIDVIWTREETEPFETDESAATPPPHHAYRKTARITIPEPLPVPAWSDSEVARLLAISSPPASPLSPWSSSPPQIPFPLSPPSPVLTAPPPSPIRSLGYRAATIRMRAEAAATSHSLPLPPPFILSPTTDQMHHHPCPHQLLLHCPPTMHRFWDPRSNVSPERYVDMDHGFMDEKFLRTLTGSPNTTREDYSTFRDWSPHAGAGDSIPGHLITLTGAGYCITETAGTHWGSCIAEAARGGW